MKHILFMALVWTGVFAAMLLVFSCGMPPVSELFSGKRIHCDIEVEMPDEAPERGEKIKVKAALSGCHEEAVP